MRILIVSDSHRQDDNLKRVLGKIGKIDMLIHLGDVEGSEDCIQGWADCPVHMVAGNNDFFSELEKEKEIMIGENKALLTHGHYYGVTLGAEQLKRDARARGFQIAMYGHTHRPYLDIDSDITVLNPGSISYPRQDDRKPSYMLMEIDEKGEAHYRIHHVER